MKKSQVIKELEAQIALDKKSYDEIDHAEAQMMENIPQQGFSAVSAELDYRGRKEELANSIRVGEERLAGVRSQPDHF